MKIAMVFASLVVGLAGVGMAQAAPAPANEANVQGVSAGHDPYYPILVSASSGTRSAVVKDLQQPNSTDSFAETGHNAYYPAHVTK